MLAPVDRAILDTFGAAAASLSAEALDALSEDVQGLAEEVSGPADELDYFGAATELRRRIGGPNNLTTYVTSLLAGRKGSAS